MYRKVFLKTSFGKIYFCEMANKLKLSEENLFKRCFCLVRSLENDNKKELLIDSLNKQNCSNELINLFDNINIKNEDIKIIFNESFKEVDQSSLNPLIVNVEVSESFYNLTYIFNSSIYSKEEITIIDSHFNKLVNELNQNNDINLDEIDIISDFEKEVIAQSNETTKSFSESLCIHERITKTAEEFPDKVALEYKGELMTYKELEMASNKFSRYLTSVGVKRNCFVGIMLPRGIELVVAMIGVMKSGATYIPLSKSIPISRVIYMLENSKATAVVTNEDLEIMPSVNNINMHTIDLKEISSEKIPSQTTPKDIAAVIYTSGTTGVPKGVLIRHDTVVNYCEYNLIEMVLPVGSNVVQFAPFVFSTMIYEVVTTLFSGSRLHLVDEEIVTDIHQFQTYIDTHPINFLLLPSQYVNYIKVPESINTIETGASDCQVSISNKIDTSAKHLHAYGLTEGSIVAVWKRNKEEDYSTLKKIPIGKPVYNTKAYVLNAKGMQQGMYMQGELCVTGLAISNGYLNLPELTRQRFVENPFGDGTMLRTGDIVQWNYRGELEYIGRMDNQVKVRGMRVEVEEIEYQLAKNKEILAAAVIAKEDEVGEHYLVAFVVSSTEIDTKELHKKIATQLLDYMVPAFIKQLPQMPMTANGKVDKKALAEIKIVREKIIAKPKTETEAKLVTLFEKTLNVEEIGIEDNFFEMGGHSLRASKLLNLIEENFSVRLNFSDIFELLTPEKIAKAIDMRKKTCYQPIVKSPQAAYYPLSPAQKRMYFVSQLEQNRCTYNLPYIVAINGCVALDKMTNVFQDLLNRHDVLRTHFELVDGEPVQVIAEKVKAYVSFQNRPDLSIKSNFEELPDFIRPFDLGKAPLIRFELIYVSEGNSLLLIDMHHLISDGMSLNILIDDLSDLFNGKILPPVKVDYKDYVNWINNYDDSKEANYWNKEFNETPEMLNLPLDKPRPPYQSLDAGVVQNKMDVTLTKRIKQLAKEQNATEYMVFLSALMILLRKYSRQEEIVVGSPISGRVHQDTEKILGLFINSLTLKGYPNANKKYLDFLSEIKETSLNAFENQMYSFDKLVDSLNVSRDLARHPLFDVMLVVQNNEKKYLNFEGFKTEVIIPEEKNAQYDLTFSIKEIEDCYELAINFSSALFNLETIQYLEKHFETILNQITKEPKLLIKEILTTDTEEEELIRVGFNQTNVDYDTSKTVIDLFEEKVLLTPDKEILIFENQRLTYRQLNTRANQLANYFRNCGIKPNDFIALVTTRSVEMFIGALAVLKSGAAYVPINTNLPEKRLAFMIENLNPAMIVTYNTQVENSNKRKIVDLESFNFDAYDEANLKHVNQKDDAVYCIYTSGTTGKPKGVVIEHKNMSNYCQTYPTMREASQIKEASLLSVSEYSFDIFTTDFLFALTNSICVFLANEQQAIDPSHFVKLVQKSKAKIMKITPTKFKLLTSYEQIEDKLNSLELLIVGGEQVPADFMEYARLYTQAKVVNAYGPTETSVLITDTELTKNRVTIGKPIANCSIYIESDNKLSGIGIPGEMLISGAGVGRGYLKQEQLTKEKFKENPYGKGIIYSTGDLGRWLPDGNIEYLGRIDNQVKIRGFRIELDEIAVILRKQPDILDAAVITRQDSTNDPSIHAYVVSETIVNLEDLKEALRKELPDYMVPMYLLQIEKIPLNSSGKLNRTELPVITLEIKDNLAPLKNDQEKKVADIFCNVLGIKEVGATSNFFELGGHSLRLTSIVNSLEQVFGQRLTLQEIYANPTVEGIASLLNEGRESIEYQIPKVKKQAHYVMSPAQQRQFIVNQMEDVGVSYNIPSLFKVKGKIDKRRLQEVMNLLMTRHEILRTNFKLENHQLVQYVNEELELQIDELTQKELSKFETEHDLLDYLVRPFDLSNGPLIRMSIAPTSDDMTYLFVDMHHIISDGASVNILLKEFSQLYSGQLDALPELTIQYKDYSEWVKTKDVSRQLDYWKKELTEGLPVLNLPLDFSRTANQNFEGQTLTTVLSADIRKQVESLAKQTETTPYMILLSMVMILLSKQSLQEEVIVGSPVSGRTNEQTEELLGMFVNNLILRGNASYHKKYLAFLEEIKEMSVNALENQDLPYEKIIDLTDTATTVNRNPLFDVMFVYQNDEVVEKYLEKMNIIEQITVDSIAKFDLSIMISEKKTGYELSFNYATALFKETSITYLMNHFECLMRDILSCPDKEIGKIQLVSNQEKRLILEDFNQPIDQPLLANSVIELFKENVFNHPEKEAVVFRNDSLTYSELNEKSDRVANYLLKKGVEKGDHIALLFTRSIDMIVGMLGVVKTGAVYIPIEPSTPDYRISTILSESNPHFILTNVDNYQHSEYKIISIHTCFLKDEKIDGMMQPCLNQDDILYILFTSGTTGKPKGVVVKQEGVLNLQNHFRGKFDVSAKDNILQFANYTFDASVWEISMALLNGGTLYLTDEDLINNTEEMTRLLKESINVVTFPPQYAEQLPLEDLGLRLVITAGSKAIKDVALKLRGNSRFINAYGPSETTVCATSWEDDGNSDLREAIPIGEPIGNSHAYIMAENDLVGVGMPGELCVSGKNVSKGYLHMEEKTNENFVMTELSNFPLYKTGDLARFKPDGNIEYMGRIDRQVKLRGFRIELIEVEESLREVAGVQEAAVILKADPSGSQVLAGFVVMNNDQPFNQAFLTDELSNKLPSYMVPSYITELDEIPMTLNGKLDEKKLPEIKKKPKVNYEAASSEVEQILVKTFEDVLEISKISVTDSFFELGGDSIKAIRIVSKLRELGYELEVKEIIQSRTIKDIAKSVKEVGSQVNYNQKPVVGEVPLTPIQHYFYDNQLVEPEFFNQSVMLESQLDIDSEMIKEILNALVEHHDVLRSTFNDKKQIIANIGENSFVEFKTLHLDDQRSEMEVKEQIKKNNEQAQQTMNLSKGPLFKAILYKTEKTNYLFMTIHHLVVDGVSWRILLEDFSEAFNQIQTGKSITFPAKTASYKEWSNHLSEYGNSQKLGMEVNYWKQVAKQTDSIISTEKQSISDYSYQTESTKLGLGLTNDLIYRANASFNTEISDLLLSALGRSVATIFDVTNCCVQVEGHGREAIGDNELIIDRTVGWFTSVYPVLLELENQLESDVISVKENLRKVPNNGVGYNILKYNSDYELPKMINEIGFNYLGNMEKKASNNSAFEVSTVSVGKTVAEQNNLGVSLLITTKVEENQLVIDLIYNDKQFETNQMVDFIDVYKKELTNIIEYCVSHTESTKTLSDFGVSDLNLDDLDALNELLDDL